MANRLSTAVSPYLRQHADNPVDWWQWGPEAFREAERRNVPVLLSIGYSACHWCHVMARESFSDPATARIMNENFVSVKVDREERPDVDAIYMAALQALTGSGGWPLTAVLTPSGKPFFAGTYWPDEARHGLPAFRDVLQAASRAWRDDAAAASSTAEDLRVHLGGQLMAGLRRTPVSSSTTAAAVRAALARHDPHNGGFSPAPKFPPHSLLRFLLARPEPEAEAAALHTIRQMACGGIFDQLGGGLSRYTVDAAWRIPHFEKMLFDSAQFLGLLASAWRRSGEAGYLGAARLAAGWLLGSMRRGDGAFMSAMSAESGGREGGHYLWDYAEARQVLSDAGLPARLLAAFGMSPEGNFDGLNIPRLDPGWWARTEETEFTLARRALSDARARREAPAVDDKVLTSWNGLAIENLSRAGRLLATGDYVQAARQAAAPFLDRLHGNSLSHSLDGNGPLLLEDLAFLGNGLLELYQATLDPATLMGARRAAAMIAGDYSRDGALYSTTADNGLLWRPREQSDSGVPADTAEAARLLLRLGRLTDDGLLLRLATGTIEAAAAPAAAQPDLLGSSLFVMDEYLAPATELVLFGDRTDDALLRLAAELQGRDLPHALLLHESAGAGFEALLTGRESLNGKPTAWLCRDRSCLLPVTDAAALAGQLDGDT